jgi:hypothetical protein
VKRILFVALFLAAAAVMIPARAQTLHDDIALTRQEIQTDRQAIVAANLQLSEAEGKAFWPLYRAYRQDIEALGDRMVKLMEDYAANYKTLTDEKATALLDESLKIQADEIKVMTKHAKQMRASVSGKTVARFFQIENQLNHILRAELADEIPLVKNK